MPPAAEPSSVVPGRPQYRRGRRRDGCVPPDIAECRSGRIPSDRMETFNSDLYVTAATVIPVLFIALLIPEGILMR